MEQIDDYKYDKINYQKYQKRLLELINNEKLKKLGIKKTVVGKTEYGYDIDCITIGNGNRELFIVGGTHGSEVIGVDFILSFIEKIPSINLNDIKLVILPLQNPEGFDISSNTFNNINIITPDMFISNLKDFINTNINWNKLSDTRVLPNITIFNNLINSIINIDNYKDLQIILLDICNKTISKLSNNMQDEFLKLFIKELKDSFANSELWKDISHDNQIKLYQDMFKEESFEGLKNSKLSIDIDNMYDKYNHPKGSQIGHDATGIGINLNANNKLNPGIDAIKNKEIIYGPFVKSNIKNYFPGPLGTPTKDVYNFSYAIENQVLENLIQDSYADGRYLATLLYHGTGGMIFYKPYKELMDEDKYLEYFNYNEELANIYSNSTGYRLLDSSSTTGYGDYLRRTYPGVLLIELSKMGGNPIGPYGDKNNIYNVLHDNTLAITSLIDFFNKKDLVKEKSK